MPTPRDPQIDATELLQALRVLFEDFYAACVESSVGAMNRDRESSLSQRDVAEYTAAAETLEREHGDRGKKAAELIRSFVEQYR